jgi:chromosome segregation ATPase
MNIDTVSPDNVRKQLKITVLQTKIDQLQKDIDEAMNNIETMSNEFASTMHELQQLKGNNTDQNKQYMDLLSRMSGDQKNTRTKYDACNTSEEMLHMMMQELDQNKESDTDTKELPDVGDNSEIWDRIAKAQKKANRLDVSDDDINSLSDDFDEEDEVSQSIMIPHETL